LSGLDFNWWVGGGAVDHQAAEAFAEAMAGRYGQKKPADKPLERQVNARPEPDAPRSRPTFEERILDGAEAFEAVFANGDRLKPQPAEKLHNFFRWLDHKVFQTGVKAGDRDLTLVPLRSFVRGGRISINGVSP